LRRLSLYQLSTLNQSLGYVMPRKPNPPPDDPEQSKCFIELAREVGADSTKEEFERAFKKVAKTRKPKPATDTER
jgi:hypothetical protein